jgi:hypothetical protein
MWRCPKCDEEHEDVCDSCPKCGAEKHLGREQRKTGQNVPIASATSVSWWDADNDERLRMIATATQFRLRTLLWLFVVLGSSLAVFGGMNGIIAFAVVVVIAVYVRFFKSLPALVHAVLWVVCLVAFIGLLAAGVSAATKVASGINCHNRLKYVMLALHKYHQANGCFPPAYVADKNGNPMYSWRVLILPYLDQQCYKQFNLNEPWDGPHNRQLSACQPNDYLCPRDYEMNELGPAHTNYVAVVGTNAAWPGEKPVSLDYLASRGGASKTIMVVEVGGTDINWAEPRDLSLDAIQAASGDAPVVTISSKHESPDWFFYSYGFRAGGNVGLADGSVQFLSGCNLTADRIPRLLSIGGYDDQEAEFAGKSAEAHVNWPNCIAFAVWLGSIGVLLFLAVRARKPAGT